MAKGTKSFNLSLEGLYGATLNQFLKRIQMEIGPGIRFHTIVIEYAPHQLSKFKEIDSGNRRFLTGLEFVSWKQALSALLDNPFEGVKIVLLKMFRPSDLKSWIGDMIRPGEEADLRTRKLALERASSVFRETPPWSVEKFGFYNWNRDQTPQAFDQYVEKLHQAENWRSLVKMYVEMYGIKSGFRFSSVEFEQYIDSIDVARSMAESVVLLRLPSSPELQDQFHAHVDDRQLKERLTPRAALLDLSRVDLPNSQFIDPGHLKPEAVNQFASEIAKFISRNRSTE